MFLSTDRWYIQMFFSDKISSWAWKRVVFTVGCVLLYRKSKVSILCNVYLCSLTALPQMHLPFKWSSWKLPVSFPVVEIFNNVFLNCMFLFTCSLISSSTHLIVFYLNRVQHCTQYLLRVVVIVTARTSQVSFSEMRVASGVVKFAFWSLFFKTVWNVIKYYLHRQSVLN